MGTYLKRLSLIFIPLLLLISCSQSVTEIRNVYASVVFDYEDLDSEPHVRFSVFTNPTTNVRRCDSIRVKALSNNYTWQTSQLIKLQNGSKLYAGYNNFVMPEDEFIPQGEYEVDYIEADDSEYTKSVMVKYSPDYYELKANALVEALKEKGAVEKISIYDTNSCLIYFGEYKSEFDNKKNITQKYKNAETFQKIWTLPDNSVYCILPIEKLF